MKRRLIVCILPALFFVLLTKGQGKKATPSYYIHSTTEKITIDGVLDEKVWNTLPAADSFFSNYPTDSNYAKTQTKAYLTFDQENLYVAAICYDSIPGPNIVQTLKRDFPYNQNDCFMLYLDPLKDKNNGFSFGVSALGVQREALISSGGYSVNISWDNKWFSAVRQYDGYWVVEMAIPFKTLRYNQKQQSWGLNFSRLDQKRNETSTWSPIPRVYSVNTLTLAGNLNWTEAPPKAGLNLSVIPYGKFTSAGTSLPGAASANHFSGGGDAKIGITSSLNLDLTFNPDFSEADVDQQVINLDRFSIFFPEQRTFFQENADLFSSFGFSRIRPFFSRRIGLYNGQIIPIKAGARLSGKLNSDWRIGVMSMETAANDSLGLREQNYTVGAFQRQIGKASNLGGILVNRQGYQGGFEGTDYNRIAGLDYNFSTPDNRFRGKVFYHQSFSPNQQPDAYAHASWAYYTDNHWEVMWNHEYVGKNYNAEVGYVPRHGYWRLEPSLSYNIYPKSKKLIRYSPYLYMSLYTGLDYHVTDNLVQASVNFSFLNTSYLDISYVNNFIQLQEPFDPTGTGSTPLPIGDYHFGNTSMYYSSDYRKLFNWDGSVSYGTYFNGRQLQYTAGIRYRWQPYAKLGIDLERDIIYMPEPYRSAYLTLFGPKLEISFSKKLFFTNWIQYNDQVDNINISTRIQWRFRPMSDLFIVYNHNLASGDFANKNYNLIVKLNWWLNL